jgi:hypothetical protein
MFHGRPLDSRHWAAALAGALPFVAGTVGSHASLLSVLLAGLLGALLMGTVAWLGLPAWNDSRHERWTGALVIGLAGIIAAVAVVIVF